MKKKDIERIVVFLIFIIIIGLDFYFETNNETPSQNIISNEIVSYQISDVPDYSGNIYTIINDNNPNFTQEDMEITKDYYSELINDRVRICHD